MKIILTILFFLFSNALFYANAQITVSADSLNQRSRELCQKNNEASLKLALAALEVSSLQNDTVLMAESYLNIGMAQYYLSKFKEAVISNKKGYKLFKEINHSVGMSISANNLGMVYYQMGDFANAEKYYTISLNIDYSLHDTAGMALGLNNLGEIYQFKGDYQKALQYYMLSAEFEHQSGNFNGEAHSWMNIGSAYSELGNIEKGNEYYYKALTYFSDAKDNRILSLILTNLGDNYRLSGKLKQVRELLLQAIEISKKNSYEIELIQAQIYYSKILFDENKTDSAEYWLFDAMNKCIETDNNLLACEVLMQQGIIYSLNKKYEEANQYLLNAYEFADNMNYTSALQQILSQLSDNYTELGDFENALKYQKMLSTINMPYVKQDSQPIKNENIIENSSNIRAVLYGVISGAFIALMLMAIYFYYKMKNYKKIANLHSSAGKERE